MIERLRQVQLALLLAEAGARFVVVGGTARALRGGSRVPHDLDVVAAPADAPALLAALRALAPGRGRPEGRNPKRVLTPWSPVDVFVQDEVPAWHAVEVDGTELRVADD